VQACQLPDRVRYEQLVQDALRLAMASRWEEAAAVNRELLRQNPNDVEARNRLGKALMALKDIVGARDAYEATLKIEPHNRIALKNLEALCQIQDVQSTDKGCTTIDPQLFVEEPGKTAVSFISVKGKCSTLVTGTRLELVPEGRCVMVRTAAGEPLGPLEPRLSARLLYLMARGNRYQATVMSVSTEGIKLFLREVYRSHSGDNMLLHQSFTSTRQPKDVDEDDVETDELESVDAVDGAEEEDSDAIDVDEPLLIEDEQNSVGSIDDDVVDTRNDDPWDSLDEDE
jgi:tetratricopeptide (TPR) repeat protein